MPFFAVLATKRGRNRCQIPKLAKLLLAGCPTLIARRVARPALHDDQLIFNRVALAIVDSERSLESGARSRLFLAGWGFSSVEAEDFR